MEYKGYSIENDGTYGMKLIKPQGRGSVPKALRGSYTSFPEAQKAIDVYESTKKKGQKDGEASTTS